MLIGELAEATGLTAKTIRFYEEVGVLPEPRRLPNGYRDYGARDVERVVFVRQAQAAGLTLHDIGEVLAIRDRGEVPCAHVTELADRRLREVEEKLTALRETQRTLQAVRRRARVLDPDDCREGEVCHILRMARDDVAPTNPPGSA